MNEWFYAKGGQQAGPVSFEQLRDLARSGGLDPEKDMAWTSGMKDWQPVGRIDGLFAATQESAPPADPANPYAAPQSGWNEPVAATGGGLEEIMPGSDPIDVGECVKRGFELTKRNFGMILLVGLVYIVVYFAANFIFSMIAGLAMAGFQSSPSENGTPIIVLTAVIQIFSILFSLYLGMGVTRVGLNLVSGKEVAIGQLFGEGAKLPRMVGASILYYLMVFIGFLLLIVPGVYLALRFMYYSTAIVDRNMGVLESLSYSSSITTNNRLNLFLLTLVSFAIMIAGALALLVGLIFAWPVVWLAWTVAFRWMQYGNRVVEDHPGTQTPVLSGV